MTGGQNKKILLVDDSAVVRGLLARLIDAQPGMEVVSTAPNGRVGVDKTRSLNPDLVVLDIEMPVMNGLDALVEIRKTHPKTPVVMFSTLTENGASATISALELGASDYAGKPQSASNMSSALEMVKDELVAKIEALLGPTGIARRPAARPASGGAAPKGRPGAPATATAPAAAAPRSRRAVSVHPLAVVLGSSTGGPHALEAVLTAIKQPLPVPIYVTQHMPATFTRVLAERLNTKCATTVVEGENGMATEPGHCYIAPGGFHMALRRDGTTVLLEMLETPPINSCRPSVEPMFESAIKIYNKRLVGVMLTGMGADGLEGSRQIAEMGSPMVVQDEATSVVWGMPGAVAKAGLASEILPLAEIGMRISQLVGAGAGSRSAQLAPTGRERT
ncbi:MAG: chemotaxis response regulator protein-glutamate methylesterase [Actinomycetota bacterium]